MGDSIGAYYGQEASEFQKFRLIGQDAVIIIGTCLLTVILYNP